MSQKDESAAHRFQPADAPGALQGLKVLEISGEVGDYCGLLLAGLGADVVKIEPPEGSPSRRRKLEPGLDGDGGRRRQPRSFSR